MNSSSDVTTIDLTLPTSDGQIKSSDDDKMSFTVKTKIGRHGLEQYVEGFKEYIAGDLKGKTSVTCILYKVTVWRVKNPTSNYCRHLQRKHKAEYDLWSKNVNRMKKISLEDSLSSSSHISKYGSVHPRQVELTRMVFNDFNIALDLPLSITEKPAFIQAMNTVDPKFRIPSRRSITSDYLSKLHEQIINKLKNACSLADFLSLTFDGNNFIHNTHIYRREIEERQERDILEQRQENRQRRKENHRTVSSISAHYSFPFLLNNRPKFDLILW
ncbi:unnamed protein product [Rotaria sp. Silwood2]|nr:unnamed protein product [Rotaria sp. Silwood2]